MVTIEPIAQKRDRSTSGGFQTRAGFPGRVRLRLFVGFLAFVGLAVAGCTSSGSGSDGPDAVDFFDPSQVHDISVTFDQDEYDTMIRTFADSGTKDWIVAAVTVDGVSYQNVGMRLKGNSSLSALSGKSLKAPDFPAPPEGLPEECLPAGIPGFNEGAGLPGGDASADEPEGLPWLIRFDKFDQSQSHDQYRDLVIRSNTSQTSLNEVVALALLDEAGLASQAAVETRFQVNGSEAQLRLVIEHPDDIWMEAAFGSGGALYKAEAEGDYDYHGDDPASYSDVFDQEAGKDNTDLIPLIEFIAFINDADDAAFNAEIGERLDLNSFARYLAMQDLIENFDDIDGPGNNSYLHYDPDSSTFTVVPWDMNLAFSDLRPPTFENGPPPLPEGCVLPEGLAIPGGPGDAGSDPFGVPEFGSNTLVDRFLANLEFERLYQDQTKELTVLLYDSGFANDLVATWVQLLEDEASDLVDSATIQTEVAQVTGHFPSSS